MEVAESAVAAGGGGTENDVAGTRRAIQDALQRLEDERSMRLQQDALAAHQSLSSIIQRRQVRVTPVHTPLDR